MQKRIREQSLALSPLITALRRDLHQHPEKAWCEYRTTALLARHLTALGYTIVMGPDAHVDALRHLVPGPEACAREQARALAEGADPALLQCMGQGFTGLWADLPCPQGSRGEGPCVALRFDLDALELQECPDQTHRPTREGFASLNPGLMHGCGHDGHTALGMGVAAILKSLQQDLHGTVRLIFQPAEEGGLGAAPMTAAGAVDAVDVIIGLHFGIQTQELGEIICGSTHFLATNTFAVDFDGSSAHAGLCPHLGQNALLAACTATLNMHAISRHGEGETRINVGQVCGGSDATNIVPAHARLKAETRGISNELNNYMLKEARRIIEASAHMWDCRCTLRPQGECQSGSSDPQVAEVVAKIASNMGSFPHIVPQKNFNASEDFTNFLNKVQAQGGQGTYIQLGTQHPGGHHTSTFDFDEAVFPQALELLTLTAAHYLK